MMNKNLTPKQILVAAVVVLVALLLLFTSDIPREMAREETAQRSAKLEATKARANGAYSQENPLTVRRTFSRHDNEQKNTQRIIIIAAIAIIATVVLCSLDVPKKMVLQGFEWASKVEKSVRARQ